MLKQLTFAVFLCFATTTGFAQSPLNGKWATDRQTQPVPMGERREIVQLDLNIESNVASGSVAFGGLGGIALHRVR